MPCCDSDDCPSSRASNSTRWRQALWMALAINAGFFLIEIVAGVAAGSVSLQADALDFLGDTANYAVSLAVAGVALALGGRAPLGEGARNGGSRLWVFGFCPSNPLAGTSPPSPQRCVLPP